MNNPDEIRRFYHGAIVISTPCKESQEKDGQPVGDGWDHELWITEEVTGKPQAGDVCGRDSEGRDHFYRPVEKVGTCSTLGEAIAATKTAQAATAEMQKQPAEKPAEDIGEEDTEILPEATS